MKRHNWIMVLVAVAWAAEVAGAPAESAREILNTAGVKGDWMHSADAHEGRQGVALPPPPD